MNNQKAEETNKIVSIEDLCKTYTSIGGDPLCALKGAELDVKEGEFVTVVGPSGCGKSTLLKIISGILPYNDGKVVIRGKRVDGPVGGIGMVFQTPALLPWRKVIGNVLLPIEMLREDVEDYVNPAQNLLELAGLKGFEDKYPFELSGGMQQRVSICRALIHDPPILLMDEPFGALDALTRDEMGFELLRIWNEKKKTVVFVTHSIPEAVFLADRVAIMSPRPGRIISVEEIDLSRPRNLETKATHEFSEYINIIRKKITRVLPDKAL
jgi:NitT/TauT family transport system ATP-binding protein